MSNDICQLCQQPCSFDINCPHPKNGYCWKFNLEAKADKIKFNMHDRIQFVQAEGVDTAPFRGNDVGISRVKPHIL